MEYKVTRNGDTTTIAISGELDALTVPYIRPTFNEVVKPPAKKIVLDCAGLQIIDSSGNCAIVSLFKQARTNGSEFEVVGARGQPLQIMQVLRLDQIFRINGQDPKGR